MARNPSYGVLLLLALAASPLTACTSRTLPLPPPAVDPIDAPPGPEGLVTVTGLSQEGASVGVINNGTLEGVIVTTQEVGCDRSCPFEAQVAAEPGDRIRVWQFFETGDSTDVDVP